jgi:septal ring factor EnvC (AmiA/AmiB activator)
VDQQAAIDLYLNVDRLRQHVSTATRADKVATLRLVRRYVADQRLTRDNAVAKDEALLAAARQRIEGARETLRQAQAAEREIIGRIDRSIHAFNSTAAVLESRAVDHHTPHELAMADAPWTAIEALAASA